MAMIAVGTPAEMMTALQAVIGGSLFYRTGYESSKYGLCIESLSGGILWITATTGTNQLYANYQGTSKSGAYVDDWTAGDAILGNLTGDGMEAKVLSDGGFLLINHNRIPPNFLAIIDLGSITLGFGNHGGYDNSIHELAGATYALTATASGFMLDVNGGIHTRPHYWGTTDISDRICISTNTNDAAYGLHGTLAGGYEILKDSKKYAVKL